MFKLVFNNIMDSKLSNIRRKTKINIFEVILKNVPNKYFNAKNLLNYYNIARLIDSCPLIDKNIIYKILHFYLYQKTFLIHKPSQLSY
jgi:spore coat polysaccharide biosynthesis protein SpsF (cytidylyltransferase family)